MHCDIPLLTDWVEVHSAHPIFRNFEDGSYDRSIFGYVIHYSVISKVSDLQPQTVPLQ